MNLNKSNSNSCGHISSLCTCAVPAPDLCAQPAAALTHYTLTQAEGKVVPLNRASFRQDLNSLVTDELLMSYTTKNILKY